MKKNISMLLACVCGLGLCSFPASAQETPLGVSAQAQASGTFYEYFADAGFAALVAASVGKQPGDATTPEELAEIQALAVYGQADYQIRSLNGIEHLPGLTSLMVSDQQLTALPAAMADLQNLTWLDLSYNQLKNISFPTGSLQSLQYLCLRANRFDVMPDFVLHLDQLTELDFRGNKAEGFNPQEDWSQLQELQTIRLDYMIIPDSIWDLPNVRVYDIKLVDNAIFTDRALEKFRDHLMDPDYQFQIKVYEEDGLVICNYDSLIGARVAPRIYYQMQALFEELGLSGDLPQAATITVHNESYTSYKTAVQGQFPDQSEEIYSYFPYCELYNIMYQLNYYFGGSSSFHIDVKQRWDIIATIPTPFVISGAAASDKGFYDVSLTGVINTPLNEGVNILRADQLQDMTIKGQTVSSNGTYGTWNKNKIVGAEITVEQGVVTKAILAGKVKTADQKQDTFTIDVDLWWLSKQYAGDLFALSDFYSSGQYNVSVNGKIPEGLADGWHNFSAASIKNMNIHGAFLHKSSGEYKFVTQNDITSLRVAIRDGKISTVSVTGIAKTPNGTREAYMLP